MMRLLMPIYEVEFEAKAYDDLKEIVHYLTEYSLKALQKFQEHLESHLKLLRKMPKIGSVHHSRQFKEIAIVYFVVN